MVNLPVIAKRELNTYFLSPIAYLVLTGFAIVYGLLFVVFLGGERVDLNQTATMTLWVALYLMILAAPIITMRLFSEESSTGTLETLLTTPVSDLEVVLGKFMAALLFGIAMLIPIAIEFVFLAFMGALDWGPMVTGMLGVYLLTAQFLAIGLFCSSLTRAQIGAAVMSFVILLGLFFVWLLVKDKTSNLAEALKYLAPPIHFEGFAKGVIDTRDLVHFLATTVLFLWLTLIVLQFRRWWGTSARQELAPWQRLGRQAIVGAIVLLVAFFVGSFAAAQFAGKMKWLGTVSLALRYASAVLGVAVVLYLLVELVIGLSKERKARVRANLAVIALLALALVTLVCYISTRRFARIDMTGKLRYTLNSKTENMLRSLDKPVTVTVLWPGEMQPAMAWVLGQSKDMLDEFRAKSSNKVTVQQLDLSSKRDMPQLEGLLSRVGRDIPDGCVIFEVGDRHEVIELAQLMELPPPYSGMGPKFRGEAAFDTALAKLIRDERAVVYFLVGHGERPMEGEVTMPGEKPTERLLTTEAYSLSRIVDKIRADNYEARLLNLSEDMEVPDDCAVLVVPGPRSALPKLHLEAIRRYITDRNGRAMLMVDSQAFDPESQSNMNELLAVLGIQAHLDAIGTALTGAVDVATAKRFVVASDQVPITQNGYARHPITSGLQNYEVLLLQCAPLEVPNPSPRPGLSVQPLLTSIMQSWGERTRWRSEQEMMKSRYDQGKDVPGPVVAAVVVEPAPPEGMPFMMEKTDMPGPKVVVIGSSFSFITKIVDDSPANMYFVLNAVNWMAGREFMVGIPPKDVDINLVQMSDSRRAGAFWLCVVGVPACIIVLGTAVWQLRRR